MAVFVLIWNYQRKNGWLVNQWFLMPLMIIDMLWCMILFNMSRSCDQVEQSDHPLVFAGCVSDEDRHQALDPVHIIISILTLLLVGIVALIAFIVRWEWHYILICPAILARFQRGRCHNVPWQMNVLCGIVGLFIQALLLRWNYFSQGYQPWSLCISLYYMLYTRLIYLSLCLNVNLKPRSIFHLITCCTQD